MLTFAPTYQVLYPDQASDYLAFLSRLDGEAQFMHYRSGERSMNEQGMRSRIKKQDKQGNSFVVLALGLDGLPIGYFSVNGGNSASSRHSATVAVGVLQAYQGQGVGMQLFDRAWMRCEAVGIRRLECTVVDENIPAINFYLACGFRRAGVLSQRYFALDCTLHDELVLELLL